MKPDNERIAQIAGHYEAILRLIGEDPSREGLVKTPMRAAKALVYATSGYFENATDVINSAIFTNEGSRMIIVRDIEYYSFCEHHILPFFGTISIGYIPDKKILGLSKLARIVNMYSRRLQVQERMTNEICRELAEAVGAKGVIAYCKGAHLCMKMRGVEKQESETTTLDYNGIFETEPTLRQEFLSQVQ